jgi:hypothetical protein
MTPSFLEHWAQRVAAFGVTASGGVAAESGLDFNAFEGMVIMVIHWLGSTITAHQFFKGVP